MTPDMTLDRLRALLDAFGGSPERWPEAERDAALALVATSAEARALRDAATALDTMLDRSPAAVPSDALAARVLAGAPDRVPAARARVVPLFARAPRARVGLLAGLGLAAAATLALWLVRRADVPHSLEPAVVAELGDYETPTDELLVASDLDADDTIPDFGCEDPELGCNDDAPAPRPAAMGPARAKEMHA